MSLHSEVESLLLRNDKELERGEKNGWHGDGSNIVKAAPFNEWMKSPCLDHWVLLSVGELCVFAVQVLYF